MDPRSLQVIVTVLIAVVALSWLAVHVRVAAALVLLAGGVPLAFLPWLHDLRVPPSLILVVVLPALLYWDSLTTSLREIRASLSMVLLNSLGLVLATAWAVAAVGHALGLSWPAAWILGAILAPTDASAIGRVAARLPRRMTTMLRAESVVSDVTALVVFAVAMAVATHQHAFTWTETLSRFAVSFFGGLAAGLAIAWLAVMARKLARDPLLENGINVVAPFAAFLLAEQLHASGVLAVLACGLTFSHVGPRLASGRTRIQARAFWQLTAFLLSGTLFILVGTQLPHAILGTHHYTLHQALVGIVLVAATTVGIRLTWIFTVTYLTRLLDRSPAGRSRRLPPRQVLVLACSGLRGGTSLAMTLVVTVTTVPGRNLIVVVAFGVILLMLLGHGLTLPTVIRHARLPDTDGENQEELIAERAATEAALAALPGAARRLRCPDHVSDLVRTVHEHQLLALHDAHGPPDGTRAVREVEHTAGQRRHHELLGAALLPYKRAALVRLRDEQVIDDIVLRRVQARIDAEELQLEPAEHEE
ncbi:Na+/H+ antiporter [Amycolatopsis sp. DSM 110486]|uniref:Na+/H+ antiporter n=1 Tax=Amycolatopsis sp. DSM 110486 TaxID=2865832 RepID=UPI001C6956E5|nr:Na+/H+ antiporter [Amycolatopsis sp. DSM 110486]QYN26425.1 Na+/H+ antiporter [Amycolatopsis sp. DSM 110486]